MKKNKAFTLVELLAVLAVLAIIMIVAITPMVTKMQKIRSSLSDSQKQLIYSATETYIRRYKNRYPTIVENVYCISLKELVHEGLLQDTLINQLNDENISLERTVKITVESRENYHYDFDTEKSICSSS